MNQFIGLRVYKDKQLRLLKAKLARGDKGIATIDHGASIMLLVSSPFSWGFVRIKADGLNCIAWIANSTCHNRICLFG